MAHPLHGYSILIDESVGNRRSKLTSKANSTHIMHTCSRHWVIGHIRSFQDTATNITLNKFCHMIYYRMSGISATHITLLDDNIDDHSPEHTQR